MNVMYEPGFYFDWLAAAFVRGLHLDPELAYPRDEALCMNSPLEDLIDEDLKQIVLSGTLSGIRLHRFKRSDDLPRVAKVLSILHGIAPASLLEVGCGRGAFLWPLLDGIRDLPVTAVDKEEAHVAAAKAVIRGGVERLRASVEDATKLSYCDDSFDVVTLLEVVEHVPEAMKALSEAVRVARRYVIVSVPAREDDNPHHTHLFSSERLMEMLKLAGATRVTIDKVPDHLILIGRV
jgi:2-polyprenyl-3-methyl-5-hydroxy-6-metoxy-1,4-benzoquinol methylase